MDLSKLSYSKGDSELTPKNSSHEDSVKVSNEDSSPIISEIPSAYRKEEGKLSTSLVFVLSGGEKREKDFLMELIKQRYIHSLRVAFMSEEGQGLQPYQMDERWKEIQSAGEFKIGVQLFHLNTTDKVYLLSDVDEFYDQLVKILATNSDKQLGEWIISNPCFEIWLYYCYLNNPEKDLECLKSESIRTRSKKLKSLGPELKSGGLNPCLAFERLTTGIANSREHYDVDENKIPILFATNMHKMAEYLIETMNEKNKEYESFLKMKEERRTEMREKMQLMKLVDR